MATIEVRRTGGEDPLSFSVRLEDSGGGTDHDVTASGSDVARLSRPSEAPEAFITRCFEFLLQREPKESILRSFDISVIGGYFPDFEERIRG
ncbi:MAG: hypothetical protein ACRDJ5_08880 [Actinomycetota bacterium]